MEVSGQLCGVGFSLKCLSSCCDKDNSYKGNCSIKGNVIERKAQTAVGQLELLFVAGERAYYWLGNNLAVIYKVKHTVALPPHIPKHMQVLTKK